MPREPLYLEGLRTCPRGGARRHPPPHVRTEPVDLSELTGSGTVQVRLIPPAGTRLPPRQSPTVEVYVEVRRRR